MVNAEEKQGNDRHEIQDSDRLWVWLVKKEGDAILMARPRFI